MRIPPLGQIPRVPRVVREFASALDSRGFQCHLVGGAIRDILMGRAHTDYDIATNAFPEEVSAAFRRVVPTGIKHGTVTVFFKGSRFEVTTFRTEAGYSDGRRPDSVSFVPSITEDLSRRDFTINAMAYDLLSNRLADPHDGRRDLELGIIRAIGSPAERFREDGLRILRACRFAAQLSFAIEGETKKAITGALALLSNVSAERIRDELLKMLESPLPSIGLDLMRETGILGVVLPELAEGVGVTQGSVHCHDVFAHGMYSCDAAPRSSRELRLSALLHDIGKPRVRRTDEAGQPFFHSHERVSAEMASDVLLRLRLPTATVRKVSHLIAHHMFNFQEEWSDAAVRRLIERVGEENIRDIIALRRADQIGTCRERAESYPEGLARFAERVQRVLMGHRAFTLRRLAVGGDDVMERLGLEPGPRVGIILNALLQAVLEDPALNEREKLLEIAEKLFRERISP